MKVTVEKIPTGQLRLQIPELGIDTWSKDTMEDALSAVTEAVLLFCLSAERHGEGVEKELKNTDI